MKGVAALWSPTNGLAFAIKRLNTERAGGSVKREGKKETDGGEDKVQGRGVGPLSLEASSEARNRLTDSVGHQLPASSLQERGRRAGFSPTEQTSPRPGNLGVACRKGEGKESWQKTEEVVLPH